MLRTGPSSSTAAAPLSVHLHTSGTFRLEIHSSRLESCCTIEDLPNPSSGNENTVSNVTTGGGGGGGSRVAVTSSFLNELVKEIRSVVGAGLFNVLGRGSTSLAGEGWTENGYLAVQHVMQPCSAPAGLSSSSSSTRAAASSSAAASYVVFVLRVKDTRLSALLTTSIRKHSFIVFVSSRLLLPQKTTTEQEQEEGITSDHMNMDRELYEAVKRALSKLSWYREVVAGSNTTTTSTILSSSSSSSSSSDGALHHHLLRPVQLLEEKKSFVDAIRHASVYTEPGSGEASLFACLLLLLFEMQVTREELIVFANHHNRYLRAAAMYFVRYTFPPEEYAPFFSPSVDDETVISCAGDFSETRSMRQLAQLLLMENEVDEAWLPTLNKWWRTMVIQPMLNLIAEHRLAASNAVRSLNNATTISIRDSGSSGEEGGTNNKQKQHAKKSSSLGHGREAVGGKTTLMGFRSALEFVMFVDQAKMLAVGESAARSAALAVSHDNESDDDEEAAWAKKHGTNTQQQEVTTSTTSAAISANDEFESRKRSRAEGEETEKSEPKKKESGKQRSVAADLRRISTTHAQRAFVELLGVSSKRAFSAQDPVFLLF